MDDQLVIRIKAIMEGDAAKQFEELKKQSEAVAQAQGKQSEAAKAYAKEVETMAKFQLESGKKIEDLHKQEIKQVEALAQGRKGYAQVIKEERATMEALYQKKQALVKAYGEEADAVKEVDEALKKQMQSVAKLEDENNSLKNSLNEMRKELTPLQRDLKAVTDAIEDQTKVIGSGQDEMKSYVDSIDSLNETLTQSEAKWKQVNRFLEETGNKLKEGEAEFSTFEDRAKAAAQGMLELEKAGQKGSDTYKKLNDVFKEATKNAHEYKILEEQVASAAEGNVAKFDSISTSLSNVGNIASNIGGDLGNLMGSFAGLGSSIASLPAQFDTIAKSGAKGFSAFAQNLTAGIAAIGPMVMMAYDAIDGLIRKQEQATIDAGKNAAKQMGSIGSYMLGEKDVASRLELIDGLSEANAKLGNSLRAVSMDSDKFEAALAKANAKMRETKELGLAMEWKTGHTGGGLLGWLKDTTGDLQQWSIEVGKALASLDEIRQKAAEADKAYNSANTTAIGAMDSTASRILDLDIAIAKARKNQAEVDRLEIQKIKDENDKILKSIEIDKQKILQLQKDNSNEMRKLQMQSMQSLITLQQDLKKGMTGVGQQFLTASGFDNNHRQEFANALDKAVKKVVQFNKEAILSGDIMLDTTEKNGKKIKGFIELVYDEMGKLNKKASDTMLILFNAKAEGYGKTFTSLGEAADQMLDDNDIKGYIATMTTLLPAIDEATLLSSKYVAQLKDIDINYNKVASDVNIIIAKTKELWSLERKNDKTDTKPKPTALDKFTAPQLANVDKEVSYWLDILKKRYESWGEGIDTAKVKKAITDRTKELAEYIAKDNTLQDALKAQQTKLADLEKQLPNLTGSARTEAEKQIKATRGSITSLTEELNAALMQTAHLRADLILASQEAVKDVSNLESMSAIQNQTKDWQAEIDKIMKGYDKLSDAGKLAAQTQIAAINAVINSLADQSAALAVSARKAVEAAKTVNDGLEESYNKAKEASDAAHDMRTQAQKDEDAYQKSLKDTAEYYDKQIKALKDKGLVGTSDIKALEDMKNQALELIEDTRQLTLETQAYQDAVNKANEAWSSALKTIDEVSKQHEEWLKIFDPAGYQKLLDDRKMQTLLDKLGSYAKATDATIAKLGQMTKEEVASWEKILGIKFDASNGWQDEIKAITDYFEKATREAVDLANNTDKVADSLDKAKNNASNLNDEIKDLTDNAGKIKPEFDAKDFIKQFNEAVNGAPVQSVFDKLNNKYMESIDKMTLEYITRGRKALEEYNRTVAENGGLNNPNLTEKEKQAQLEAHKKYLEEIAKLDQEFGQKRIENAKAIAIEVANAYKTELDKLEQMQKTFDERMKSREKQTGDARLEVSDYVRRSKMTNAQKEADDIAKSLADQYQKYLTAGMKENELEEWLAIKRKELLTGKDKETTEAFSKEWDKRKKAASDFAKAEREAWDAETARQKNALNEQIQLVDQLAKLAEKAKQDLLALLGLSQKDLEDLRGKLVTPGQKSEATEKGNPAGSRSQGITLTNGMKYSQVKNQLSESQKPSASLIGMIGSHGVTDLVWKVYANNSGAWVLYRASATETTPPPPATGSGLQDNPKAVPVETSAEINARIEAYKLLETTATTVFNNLDALYKKFNENIKEVFELLKPKATDQWVKELIGAMSGLGKDIVKEFKKPFIDEFDPVYGNGLAKKMGDYGKNMIDQLAYGMSRAANTLKTEVLKLIAIAIEPYLKSNSPPKEGPLHFIDKWGYNVGETYTLSMGQGITEGTVWVNQGLTNTANTIKKSSKIMAEYAPKTLGMSTMEGTTELKALQDMYGQLTKDSTVAGMWSAREKEYVTRDMEFGAYSQGLDLAANKANIEKQTSELAIAKTQEKVNTFYKWFNKGLLSPDMGDLDESLVRQQINEHPELATWYWYTKKLEQQYPEVYKNLVAEGIIKPTATTTITDTKTGEILGRSQTGNMYDKYSVDYLETNFQGATGFNDWLQSKFNTWLKSNESMIDPTTGKSIGYGSYDVVMQRDKFLEGWSENRLSDLVTEYQNYVKGLGTVKSFDELQGQLSEKYAGTELAKSLASGKALDESLMKNKFSDILLTGKDKEKALDRTVVSGGGWYKDGKEIYDESLIKQLMSKGGGGTSGETMFNAMLRRSQALDKGQMAGKIGMFRNSLGKLFGGNEFTYAWFKFGTQDFYLPYAVMSIETALEINRKNTYDATLAPMGEADAVRLFGKDAVDQMKKKGEWPYILMTASHNQKTGDYSSIDAALQAEQEAFLKEIGFIAKQGEASGGFAEGDKSQGYEYKNKYTTVKGDYGYGVSKLSQLAGGMDDDRRKAIMDAMVARIDETYQNKAVGQDQSNVGGGVVSGDFIKVNENRNIDYSMVRAAMKTRLAEALGFTKEYAVARGWRNAMDANAGDVANEEILKWIEYTRDEIIKRTPKLDIMPVGEDQNVSETRAYLQELVKDGVTPEKLDAFKQALNMATQLGFISREQAASLVQEVLPDAVKISEQIGLTTFRGGTKEIEGFSWTDALLKSPWGSEQFGYGQEGQRQLLGEYADLDPVIQRKYAQAYAIKANAFDYYERMTPGYQQPIKWAEYGKIQDPYATLQPMPTETMPGMPMMPGMMPGAPMMMNSRVNTFSSGSGNTFYFAFNIDEMNVENGTDFAEQLKDTLSETFEKIGVPI